MSNQRLTVQHSPQTLGVIPLALYVHLPWCVKKCPYCDFNSHSLKGDIPDMAYVSAVLTDLTAALPSIWGRRISSIFIGGGTPSLFSGEAIDHLLCGLRTLLPIPAGIEITMEANPSTVDASRFAAYRQTGVNRLSLGVQSFDPLALKALGRIHDVADIYRSVDIIHQAGFDNWNIDLMFGLPHQTVETAIADLQKAIDLAPSHLSWYQLTQEPGTPFYHKPPPLPTHDLVADIDTAGQALLQATGYRRYEISAYTKGAQCTHNTNYWQYGDYLGIGAGAHSKISDSNTGAITRLVRHRLPNKYMASVDNWTDQTTRILPSERPFEFMLNVLRLIDGVPRTLFQARTGLPDKIIAENVRMAITKGFMVDNTHHLQLTPFGQRFLDDVVSIFLGESR